MNLPLSVIPVFVSTLSVFVSLVRPDNTGLLASMLFTFRDHACENEKLHIRCPYGTTVKVVTAQYGRRMPSHQMCPTMIVKTNEDTNCLSNTSFQIVLDKCQDQRTCSIRAKAEEFGDDPCPGTSKYLEVSYQCRPNEFRSRIVCEDKGDMVLKCQKKAERLAIYSAMFGRSQRGNIECPVENPLHDTECEAPCSLQTVLKKCHEKRKCRIPVTGRVFKGSEKSCPSNVKKYLSVVYTCVPRRILKKIKEDSEYPYHFCNEDQTHEPSTKHSNATDSITGDKLPGNVGRHSTRSYTKQMTPPATPPIRTGGGSREEGLDIISSTMAATEVPNVANVEDEDSKTSGIISDWLNTWFHIKEDHEKFVLYIILSVLVGIILILLVILISMAMSRRRRKRQAKLNISEPIPNSTASPPQSPEDMTLLHNSGDQSDGVDLISYNQTSTFSRPSPYQSHQANTGTVSSTFSNGGSRTYDNYYR